MHPGNSICLRHSFALRHVMERLAIKPALASRMHASERNTISDLSVCLKGLDL